MKTAPFEYHRPSTIGEAAELLAELGEGAKVLAGGQSLLPNMALRLSAIDHLVDIGRIDALTRIEASNGSLWIGAGTTEATLEHDPQVASAVPLLARATPYVGHFQIRNRGTLGGCLAHADPAAEYPAVSLALDAEFETYSPRGQRTIPARSFFTGVWSTALEPDELLTRVGFPVWAGRCGFAIEEFARRDGDFAIAGAVVAVELGADDTVARCAIGLIGLGSSALRADEAEALATGADVHHIDAAELGRRAVENLGSIPSDLHGSAAYRTRVGATMVARAFTAASEEAIGE